MICKFCRRHFYKRTEYLIHVSICDKLKFNEVTNRYKVLYSEEEIDDTDADPTWSPSPQFPSTTSSPERCSSPLTKEQIDTASSAMVVLCDESFQLEETPRTPTHHHPSPPNPSSPNPSSPNPSSGEGEESQGKCSLTREKTFKTKRNWCKYCSTLQTKLGRHIAAKHKDVEEVQQYINAQNVNKKEQKKKRREICKSIVNQSNLVYNKMIINNETPGDPIPVRRTNKENLDTTTHKICCGCGGLFVKRYFSKHKSHCTAKITNVDVAVQSLTFEPTLEKQYEVLHRKVLSKMNKDKLYKIIINDPLILEFGRRFLKCHMEDHQRNYVGSKMRSMADLFLRMRNIDRNITSFKDCVQPENFNTLCTSVQEWSKCNAENAICSIGSVPRRISKSLKICAYILVSECYKSKMNLEEQSKVKSSYEQFTALMTNDWPLEVNSAGDKSLKKNKIAKQDKMVDEQDLVMFFEKMNVIIENSIKELQLTEQVVEYENLSKGTLAYLIAFNSRRPNEVAQATIKHYQHLKVSEESANEEKLAVFTIPATKNDVKVPVIVPRIAQEAIKTLLEFRSHFNIVGDILFSKRDGKPYNGTHVLTTFKNKIPLKNSKDFTANGIRHYWATKSQTKPEIKKHMPKFLGHTLATHQKFYELPSDDVNLNIIGPLLLQHIKTKNSSISPSFSEQLNLTSESTEIEAPSTIISSNADFPITSPSRNSECGFSSSAIETTPQKWSNTHDSSPNSLKSTPPLLIRKNKKMDNSREKGAISKPPTDLTWFRASWQG